MEYGVDKKIEQFFSRFRLEKYKKGEVIIGSDATPVGVFYLKKGVVRLVAVSSTGNELTLNIFKPPAFFPVAWAINDTRSPYQHQALTGVETWRAPKEKFVEFLRQNPDVMYDLIKRIYKGIDGFLMRMEYSMAGEAPGKVIAQLVILARRFGVKDQQGLTIQLAVTHSQLAAQAGVSRETVTREIKILEDKGLISYKSGQLKILNPEGIEKALLGI